MGNQVTGMGNQAAGNSSSIDLGSVDAFQAHPWVSDLLNDRYVKDSVLAYHALNRLLKDLGELDQEYRTRYGRVAFTAVTGRIKERESTVKKLYGLCRRNSPKTGLTEKTLRRLYDQIIDICGMRIACPYYDEIERAIEELIRPTLNDIGYATDLQKDHRFKDRNYLDNGDESGYRSYHFYVRIPTQTDIYGNSDLCLCEIQVRTELQHVWAVKSHNLLYKPKCGWDTDKDIIEDMRQVSNSLRAADGYLVSIRKRRGIEYETDL